MTREARHDIRVVTARGADEPERWAVKRTVSHHVENKQRLAREVFGCLVSYSAIV